MNEQTEKWLLDTNVLSEVRLLRRASPAVTEWLARIPPARCFVSSVTIAEIRHGIEQVADPKRSELAEWLRLGVLERFASRVLETDDGVLLAWLRLIRAARQSGKTLPQPDALIAATALHHDLALVTRNVRDFGETGIRLVNPWDAS